MKTSTDLLQQSISIQQERGKDYDTTDGQKERSFAAIAKAYQAITGKEFYGDDVALVLLLTKLVRQNAQDRLHDDSVLDAVSYASLWGECLYQRFGERK